jgi:hypothetical protein
MIPDIPARLAAGVRNQLLILLLVSCARAGQHTVTVGIGVDLCKEIRPAWAVDQVTDVCDTLVGPFTKAWRQRYSHWDTVSAGANSVRAVVNLAVVAGGNGEFLTSIMLCIQKSSDPNNPDKHMLAEATWYEPRDLEDFGFPDPNETKAVLRAFLNTVFPDYQGGQRPITIDEDRLFEELPLAIKPRWLVGQDKKFVLPLPKQRYLHLRSSTFRICPKDGTCLSDVEASNEWATYDPNLTQALVVRPPDPDAVSWPVGYQPAIVFLDEYNEPTETGGWLEYLPQ